jgi:trigger factor
MAEQNVAERPNKVTVTDAGPCKKKVSIEIPAETVAEQVGSTLSTFMTEAALPGFRPGRAPARLVEKKFGSVIRREAKTQLIAQAYQQAVEDNKLKVIGEPIGEQLEKLEVEDGKPLAFEVEVEVAPEFEIPRLEGIPVIKPMMEATDELVQAEIKTMALHEGDLVEQQAASAGDYCTGRGVMKDADSGAVFLDITDAVVQCPPPEKNGKGMILGVMVDDFEKQFGLPKPGESAKVTTTGPQNHETEEIRGKKLVIEFTVSRVDRIVPASTEALVERFGLRNEGELTEAVRARIKQRVAVEQQSAMRNQVAKHLLENITIELPPRLTAAQTQRTLNRQRLELMHRGVSADKVEEHIAELRTASAEAAGRDLKLMFILDQAAESLGVKVTEGEMNGQIARIAAGRGERPEKLRAELQRTNQLASVYQQIREHKTMDAILGKGAITEMPAEEYNKTVGASA